MLDFKLFDYKQNIVYIGTYIHGTTILKKNYFRQRSYNNTIYVIPSCKI